MTDYKAFSAFDENSNLISHSQLFFNSIAILQARAQNIYDSISLFPSQTTTRIW